MRTIDKTKYILKDNSGETIIEVVVAFTLLSIMMVIFAQGLASASRAEITASNNRYNADHSFLELKKKITSASPTTSGEGITVTENSRMDVGSGKLVSYTYTVNGTKYVVYMPEESTNG